MYQGKNIIPAMRFFFWVRFLYFECYFQTGPLTKMRANFSNIFRPVSFERFWVKRTGPLVDFLIWVI